MGARTKARRRALEILYEAELRGADPLEVLAGRIERAEHPLNDYTVELVQGVTEERARLDEVLSAHSRGWTLDRMPPVDRNLLRIGAYELLVRDEVPDAVALSEAVGLAGELSTEESPGFVNGLLGRLLELKPELT